MTDPAAPHRCGRARSHTDAWTYALAGGWRALLSGTLATLAVTVHDTVSTAIYTPAGQPGEHDPAEVTCDLLKDPPGQPPQATSSTESLADQELRRLPGSASMLL